MTIKHLKHVLGASICLALTLTGSALAAPLFPDVPEDHWARDAVATLSAKGVVEGYPDGTFKGDRAASRWETAIIVARLLSKLEQDHVSFATRAELEQLQKLTQSLRVELDALGVRVDRLEQETARLDNRVTELERITFYGEYEARVGTQHTRNTGSPSLGNPALIDFNTAIGSATGAGGIIPAPSAAAGMPMNTFVFGILSIGDWSSGRPLTNGNTLTSKLTLGTIAKLTQDIEAGAEFAAYSSGGDSIVDAYWGVSAPTLSNPFSTPVGPGIESAQGLDHRPFTKLTLDNFWVKHKPSNTTLVIGSIHDQHFDPFVYVPQPNPCYYGPKYLDTYGIKLGGDVALSEDNSTRFTWEALGGRLADGNVNSLFPDAHYSTRTEGANCAFLFDKDRGSVRLNFLHTANRETDGGAYMAGLIQTANNSLQWVNPNGYFINQLDAQQTAGMGSQTDIRPISMIAALGNDGITGVAGIPNYGGIGPQNMLTYGISAKYQFDCVFRPQVFFEWATSNYKPQRNSDYAVDGQAMRAGANVSLFNNKLDLRGEYVAVDPTYDPFIIQYPTVEGISAVLWRTPGFTYSNSLFSLHDTEVYTHNREGWHGTLAWKFAPTGKISFTYGSHQQRKSSLQDVRYSANSIAPGTPTTPVIGYSPGFIDPVFGGFSTATFASDGTNDYAIVLENPVARTKRWEVAAGYKYLFNPGKSARGIMLTGGARSTHFTRHSHLSELVAGDAGIAGESQNYANFYIDGWRVGLDYDLSDRFVLSLGYTSVDLFGHLDPLGTMSHYAVSSGTTDFEVLNLEQRIPSLGFEWKVSDSVTWGVEGKFYQTHDRVKEDIYPCPSIPSLNISYGPQTGTHPFNWQCYQITSNIDIKF